MTIALRFAAFWCRIKGHMRGKLLRTYRTEYNNTEYRVLICPRCKAEHTRKIRKAA